MQLVDTLLNMIAVTMLCARKEVRGQTHLQMKSFLDKLMLNYDKRIRPVNEVNQKLQTLGYLTIVWEDQFRTWDLRLNHWIF